jgi:hypothetical protein
MLWDDFMIAVALCGIVLSGVMFILLHGAP